MFRIILRNILIYLIFVEISMLNDKRSETVTFQIQSMHRPLAIGNNKWLNYFDLILILIFSAVPLFLHFPYRINIFLSWEGAYRLYLGEVPYKDFGLPMGFGYWIVPAIFFKIFGPYLFTLIKAQYFLNIVAG